MISRENYEALRSKFGKCGSWAVWISPNGRPKSNLSNMSWIHDPNLLNILNTGFVFIGLNRTSIHDDENMNKGDWEDFHSASKTAQEYKLRDALKGTRYWGSYITDFVKYYPEAKSEEVMKMLRLHPEIVQKNLPLLEEEIRLLGGKPVLVALGDKCFNLLMQKLSDKYTIVRIKHFSYTMPSDCYRQEILEVLSHYSSSEVTL